MSDKLKLTDEERDYFRRSVGPVTPLKHDKVSPSKRPPPPHPQQTRKDEAQVLHDMLSNHGDLCELETGEEVWFARPGLQHRVIRKLRRGQFSIGADLDLHGMTVPEAKQTLAGFLKQCGLQRSRCVRIVHGKGKGSKHKPVLKGKVCIWLQQRKEVLAFCSARPADGGTGALYVLLQRRDSK